MPPASTLRCIRTSSWARRPGVGVPFSGNPPRDYKHHGEKFTLVNQFLPCTECPPLFGASFTSPLFQPPQNSPAFPKTPGFVTRQARSGPRELHQITPKNASFGFAVRYKATRGRLDLDVVETNFGKARRKAGGPLVWAPHFPIFIYPFLSMWSSWLALESWTFIILYMAFGRPS